MSVVFERLARRLRQIAVEEQSNTGTGAERFKVMNVGPLRLEQIGGSVELHEDDPDFTVGWAVRQYDAQYGIRVGDEVWCLREGAEWHLVDVTDPGGIKTWEFSDVVD